jgi:N6-L-threonylcarbamoyladenine synthase
LIILGIETSCDETAVAVLKGGEPTSLLSSQIDLHKQYGGIVPELACRRHIEAIGPLVSELLLRTECTPSQLDAVAVTSGPGLVGALLVGVSFAKGFSYALKIPLLSVHHLEGHISAVFLEHKTISFPAIALVVSGGHTSLYRMEGPGGPYRLLGKTLDDAAGEALDKGARGMGFPYPGGPIIDQLAKKGDPNRFPLPVPYRTGLNFSFSGLKTALMQLLTRLGEEAVRSFSADIAASYQKAIVESLVHKTVSAIKQEQAKSLIVVGGVAANSLLRHRMKEESEAAGSFNLYLPSSHYCTDNAAMIAMAGLAHFEAGQFADRSLCPRPKWELSAPV